MKRHNDKPIQEVLKEIVNQKRMSKGITESQVIDIWKNKLGKLIQPYTEKIWYNNGTIFIQITSAPLKNELFMGKDQLIKSFNREIGEERIKEIKLL